MTQLLTHVAAPSSSNIPFDLKASMDEAKAGTWPSHTDVNAPTTPTTTTFFPLKNSAVLMASDPCNRTHYNRIWYDTSTATRTQSE